MTEQKSNPIEIERGRLTRKRQQLVAAFGKAAQTGKKKQMSGIYIRIRETNEFLESLDSFKVSHNSLEEKAPDEKRRRYAVSSLFLHESFRKLTADEDEQFVFITGSEINNVLVLDQWAEFAHQKRTRLGVTGEPRATHGLLIKLEQFGHRLLAHFHSHPGNGAESTNPSGIDERFQQRLEGAGHVAVMAIFSRDGFVRFIRLDQNLEVEIHGRGVEKHAANVYRLTEPD